MSCTIFLKSTIVMLYAWKMCGEFECHIIIFFYLFAYHNFTEDGVNYMTWWHTMLCKNHLRAHSWVRILRGGTCCQYGSEHCVLKLLCVQLSSTHTHTVDLYIKKKYMDIGHYCGVLPICFQRSWQNVFFFFSLPISILQEGYEVCAGVMFFISSNEGYRNTTVL